MSVDARIRQGLTMIEDKLPAVDTVEGYEDLERDIRRDTRRRRVLIAAAAAAVLIVSAGAVLLNRGGGDEVEPAPPPTLPDKVAYFDDNGGVSFVAQDGTRQTFDAKNVDRLAFSPDGQQVAYITVNGSTDARRLWISDVDGTHRVRQPAPCAGCQPGFGVTWSNDGTRLAYSEFTPGKKPAQLRIRTVGTGREQVFDLPARSDARGPRFSPDDRKLAINLSGDAGAYVAVIDSAEGISSLTRVSDIHTQVQAPAWSEDGQTVYFTATTTGEDTNDVTASIDLFAVGADGSDLRQITHAAAGERFFGAQPYQGRFLISRAQGAEPWEIGWLSGDGSTFTPMKGEDGKPLLGNAPVLQP